MAVLAIGFGLVLLVFGAELLVRGAAHLAGLAGVSSLMIGLTVVAFGTSAPELAVSIQSNSAGQTGVSVGNVIGSNIFNILLILGLSATIAPLAVQVKLVRFELPVLLGVSLLTCGFACDGHIAHWEAALLVLGLIAFTVWCIVTARVTNNEGNAESPSQQQQDEIEPATRTAWIILADVSFVAVGLGALVFGANLLVDGAVQVATFLGMSELVIGLTIVAAGTSLPEAATSVVAAFRGERDIAVGNVLGSNLFNLLGVLGISTFFATDGVPIAQSLVWFDLPVMLAATLVCWPFFVSDQELSRREGICLLVGYVVYTAIQIMTASDAQSAVLGS